MGYSPRGVSELNATDQTHTHTYTHLPHVPGKQKRRTAMPAVECCPAAQPQVTVRK